MMIYERDSHGENQQDITFQTNLEWKNTIEEQLCCTFKYDTLNQSCVILMNDDGIQYIRCLEQIASWNLKIGDNIGPKSMNVITWPTFSHTTNGNPVLFLIRTGWDRIVTLGSRYLGMIIPRYDSSVAFLVNCFNRSVALSLRSWLNLALLVHSCYTGMTVLFNFWYTGVTTLVHFYYTGLTVLETHVTLLWLYSDVTLLLHFHDWDLIQRLQVQAGDSAVTQAIQCYDTHVAPCYGAHESQVSHTTLYYT